MQRGFGEVQSAFILTIDIYVLKDEFVKGAMFRP